MFGQRSIDSTPKRFWTWFSAEAQGIANALEALSRGEADAEWALAGLNARIQRVDSTLEADVVRGLDGVCCLTISGKDAAVDALMEAAPRLRGWHVAPRVTGQSRPRIPFLRAPRPSLDVVADPVAALRAAWA
jgi:hypothetical protein